MGHHHHCQCCESKHIHSEKEHSAQGVLKETWRMILSAAMLFVGILLNATGCAFVQIPGFLPVWYLLAYLPVGLPVLREAWEGIRQREYFSEFTLMSIATFGAFYIGEYPEGVAVMLFYSLGEYFQDKAVDKAKRNIRSLLDVRPEKATIVSPEGNVATVDPQKVNPGDTIEVRPGERVSLDGELLTETASFDTAALTGESLPRRLRAGEEVLAGMIATDKVVRLRVTRRFEQSALSRILHLVEEASERKAPAELFIRRFARRYTPAVTGLALLIVLLPFLYSLVQPAFLFVFNEWLYRALVFLVISCPCALVVSIPLGYFGGIGAASRMGILFKGGNYLDAVSRINAVVFDKTGTLTRGRFEVSEQQTVSGTSVDRLLQLCASAEAYSTHPVAQAIVAHAQTQGTTMLPACEVQEVAGEGVTCLIEGHRILAGNLRLLDRHGVRYPEQLSALAGTLVACAADNAYIGCLLLADTLKEDAPRAVKELKDLNINNIQILSGDKQSIVTTFARQLGIAQAYGDLLPEGKVKHIEALRLDPHNRIAFVGDGINDAPVLALSHVGIAMGGMGSDAAIETADVVIQTDQPSRVATAIRIGRRTRRIVRQNVLLAFGVKLIVLLLGAGGVATLWEAVFADVGVALLAILNAVRIGR